MTYSKTTTILSIFLLATFSVADEIADFDQNGVVDGTDLVVLTSQLNQGCDGDCPTDLNLDGVTDSTDMMILLQQWGSVTGSTAQGAQSNSGTTTDVATPVDRDLSWRAQGPVLYDAIYYDQYTRLFSHGGFNRWNNAAVYKQGERAKAWTANNEVDVQPMVYGAVDWDHDDELTEEDKANFVIWLDETVPADYNGLICLDLEGQWWAMLDSQNQVVMDYAINFYLESLEYAKSLRPNAKIGFWGFPKKTHTNPNVQTASIDRLLNACTALFPDVYENNAGGNDANRLRIHIERVIEMVQAKVPVYVQTSPRYKINSNGYRYFHELDEYIRDQVQSALDAIWVDDAGIEHGISGVALWDAYVYVGKYTEGWSELSMEARKAYWDEIDLLHVDYLAEMKLTVDAANVLAANRLAIAQQLLDTAQQQQQAAAQVAVQVAIEEVTIERKRQRSRLVRRLESRRSSVVRVSKSYKKSAKTYRAKKKSWSSAKKAFALAKGKYSKGSTQYKLALAAYKKARAAMRAETSTYQAQRKLYTAVRGKWNLARKQWKTAKTNWAQMTAAVNSLSTNN